MMSENDSRTNGGKRNEMESKEKDPSVISIPAEHGDQKESTPSKIGASVNGEEPKEPESIKVDTVTEKAKELEAKEDDAFVSPETNAQENAFIPVDGVSALNAAELEKEVLANIRNSLHGAVTRENLEQNKKSRMSENYRTANGDIEKESESKEKDPSVNSISVDHGGLKESAPSKTVGCVNEESPKEPEGAKMDINIEETKEVELKEELASTRLGACVNEGEPKKPESTKIDIDIEKTTEVESKEESASSKTGACVNEEETKEPALAEMNIDMEKTKELESKKDDACVTSTQTENEDPEEPASSKAAVGVNGRVSKDPEPVKKDTGVTEVFVESKAKSSNDTSINLAQSVVDDDGSFLRTFVGRRVYAEFPDNEQWYWGIVTSVRERRGKLPSFSVWFDDGDSLDDLSGKNILTVEEYQKKWQHIFKKPPPKLPKHLKEAEFDEKNHRIIVDETYTPSNSDTEDALDDKVEVAEHEGVENDTSRYDESFSEEIAADTTKNERGRKSSRKRKEKPEELSSSKEIGSRVYCKFKNDNYYWGEIIGKSLVDGIYVVQSDDGDVTEIQDVCDNAIEQNIFTEVEYKTIAGKEPPKKKRKSSSFHALTSKEVFNLRCKTCAFCEMEPCGRCSWCKKKGKNSSRSICIQNMCCKIPYERKKQIVPGFPSGWTFASGEQSIFSDTNFCGLMIRSPNGDTFSNVDEAMQSCKGLSRHQTEKIQVQFQSYLGGSVLYSDENHHLHQRPYMAEWTDVRGNKKVLYGTITECMLDKTDNSHTEFTVVFNDDSRADVRGIEGQFGLEVPRTQKLNKSKALGGHLAFNVKTGLGNVAVPQNIRAFRWNTPDMRMETIVSNESGTNIPRLILTWNGFRLVFSVRKSTIPQSGFGVFVECTSLIPGRRKLVLNESEMLDLGVYAPFRSKDLKLASVFLLKNYIHCLKCEEWSFDVESKNDTLQFDITNDHDGEIHEIAAKHIPAYVNECRMEDTPTVHARHDPEGAVHYLLGVMDKKFVLPADGKPSEIFINYGPDYERVRIRKNYSFLSASDQEPYKKSKSREGAEYFLELMTFGDREVSSCIRFFCDMFASTSISSTQVICRSLAVTVLLRHRGRALQKAMGTENLFAIEFESDLKACDVLIEKLLCLHNAKKLKELNDKQDFDSLIKESIEPLVNELELKTIQKVMTNILEHKAASFDELVSDLGIEL